jgi:hypothetical protein
MANLKSLHVCRRRAIESLIVRIKREHLSSGAPKIPIGAGYWRWRLMANDILPSL